MKSYQRLQQAGFTLVELAIVLLIIGLLISGILKGQELIENSRTTATVQQLRSYEAAVNTFRDSYGSLPGDSATAPARLPGCVAGNAINCRAGNGDGMIATAGATNEIGLALTDLNVERSQFWLHLAMANLVTGIIPNFGTGAGAATAQWNSAYPSGRLAGGFLVGFSNGAAAPAGGAGIANGHFVTLQAAPTIAASTAGTGTVLTADRAAQIDSRIDDGNPGTGDVIAIGTAGAATAAGAAQCYSAAAANGVYNAGVETSRACSLAVRVMN